MACTPPPVGCRPVGNCCPSGNVGRARVDDVRDVIINLVAAAIGAVAAWSVAGIKRWRRERRARRFWGGMATRGITVVVGVQDRDALGGWEPSGLVGMGDVAGLVTIQRELQ